MLGICIVFLHYTGVVAPCGPGCCQGNELVKPVSIADHLREDLQAESEHRCGVELIGEEKLGVPRSSPCKWM